MNYLKRIKKTYGLDPRQFLEMFELQRHACLICGKKLVLNSSDRSEVPCVDHCHDSGAVRGILCRACNVAVGWLEKDVERTRRCYRYIAGRPLEEFRSALPDQRPVPEPGFFGEPVPDEEARRGERLRIRRIGQLRSQLDPKNVLHDGSSSGNVRRRL